MRLRSLPLALLLLLVVPLAACETEEAYDAEPEAVPVEPMPADPMPAQSDVTVEGTLAAVPAEGLTAMDPGAALANIDGWIARLDGADFPNADEIRAGLMQLKDQLQASPRDGAAIGATLVDLGTWTMEAAPGNAGLQQLGGALRSSGQALTSM